MLAYKHLATDELPLEKEVIKPAKPRASIGQFKIFSCLWAIATLFHMAHSGIYALQLNYALLSLAAVYVISRPGNLPGFIVLILLQLYDIINKMPGVSNHWIFTAFVNVTILQALLFLIVKQRSFRVNKGEWFQLFAPAIRLEVVILYFYAVFQKLNSGFFSPDGSCATDLLLAQNLPSFIPITPGILAANAYFTLLIEGAIPVLLLFKRTRYWGILFGLIFHAVLSYSSYNAYYDFSSMVFAAYFLFASPQFSFFLAEKWAQLKSGYILRNAKAKPEFSFLKLALVIGGILVGFALVHILNKLLPDFKAFHLYFFWTIYSLAYIYVLLHFVVTQKTQTEAPYRPLAMPHWSFWLLPVVVFLNGLSPYVGLKTENSYSMFSNLRTEGNKSNHFLVPVSLQVFDYQKDMVEIVTSSDAELQKIADSNSLMVFFTFKDLIAQKRPDKVEYIRNGVRQTFEKSKAAPTHELLHQNNIILRKLMRFRLISKYDPQPCSH